MKEFINAQENATLKEFTERDVDLANDKHFVEMVSDAEKLCSEEYAMVGIIDVNVLVNESS